MSGTNTKRASATAPFSRETHDGLFLMHAWMGVVGGVLLHLMFFTGTFALFKEELGVWQRSERTAFTQVDPDVVRAVLERRYPNADRYGFALTEAGPTAVHVHAKTGDARTEENIDLATATVTDTSATIADFLYELHFLHQVPGGTYISGLMSVLMLIALATGLCIHLRDLPRHIVRVRLTKSVRVIWSDAHKVLGTLGLPFQLLFAFSGALLCLGAPLLGVFALATYDGDRPEALAAFGYGGPEAREKTGRSAPSVPLSTMLADARREVPGFDAHYVIIDRPRDETAVVTFFGDVTSSLFARGVVAFDAASGARIFSSGPRTIRLPGRIAEVFFGLHFGAFWGLGLRIVYAFFALATCATVLSGNAIWLNRRLDTHPSGATTFLLRLSTGGGATIVAATAVMFLVNRLLGMDALHRGAIEQGAFVTTLVAGLAYAFIARDTRRSTRDITAFAALAFIAAVLADVVGHDGHGLDAVMVVDVLLFVLGLASVALARRMSKA
jgi:uncharacterized iron-regulated membrane protein